MNDRPGISNGWSQLPLFTGGTTELTLRVGIAGYGDHVQIQIDVRDPSTGELLGMRSLPHVSLEAAPLALMEWLAAFREECQNHLTPFP